jgi:hypothetical protein
VIYWVNRQGSLCLSAGAVFGLLAAGVGKVLGPAIGLGETGYVLGIPVGGLAIILVDIALRCRAYLHDECGLFAAFLFPSNGGTVNWSHASFNGLFFIAIGVWLFSISHSVQSRQTQQEARKAAGKQETDRLARITQRLPREGIAVKIVPVKDGDFAVTLTNQTGKDFAKAVIRTRSRNFGSNFVQTLEWPAWKAGESKTFTDPVRGAITEFGFDMEGYPPGCDEPRFVIINFGYVKNGVWEQAAIGS